jgi:KDO2-lipid IV(A) lauroyltransferase
VATGAAVAAHGTFTQRARASLVAALSWLVCRLPERPLIGLAAVVGEAWYRSAPARARRARANLARICAWLAAHDAGPAYARAAAHDPAALERMVRSAFRHGVRYYLELLRFPAIDARYIRDRLVLEDAELARELLEASPGIIIGLHFGALEMPARYISVYTGRELVGPMEALDDPSLQRWILRSRAETGMRIIPIRGARRELGAVLGRGGLAGLVADRDIAGNGTPTELFGEAAPLPAGPAILAAETGAPAYAALAWRRPDGRYGARVERIPSVPEGPLRDRVRAFLDSQARAFERLIAVAPEQWWAVFFEIWPDRSTPAAPTAVGAPT